MFERHVRYTKETNTI